MKYVYHFFLTYQSLNGGIGKYDGIAITDYEVLSVESYAKFKKFIAEKGAELEDSTKSTLENLTLLKKIKNDN